MHTGTSLPSGAAANSDAVFNAINTIPFANSLRSSQAVEKKVLMVPGASFVPTNGETKPISPYVRAAYSNASAEEMNEACLRLKELLLLQGGQEK